MSTTTPPRRLTQLHTLLHSDTFIQAQQPEITHSMRIVTHAKRRSAETRQG